MKVGQKGHDQKSRGNKVNVGNEIVQNVFDGI